MHGVLYQYYLLYKHQLFSVFTVVVGYARVCQVGMHRLDKETTSVSDECGFGTSHVWLGDCRYTGSHSPSIPTSPKTCTGTVCKVSRITTHTHTPCFLLSSSH